MGDFNMKTICPYCKQKADLPKWKYFTNNSGQRMKSRKIGKTVYFEMVIKGTKLTSFTLPYEVA